ncbi:unnamed protein product [Parnassius apollo]|uniref:(apollo) hypothetical protein n=1 Tax=Parnassius apollo TaxID=110799 RepID=A0A8S3Y9A9_PARAO|nr:unnamed protein product [Parnassius apollo]
MQHYLHVHLKLRPKLRTCHVCGVKFAPHLRAEHFEKAHGVPAPSCGACGKKFAYPNLMLRHQKLYHMGEKKYSCNICDMAFKTRSDLTKHAVKHLDVRTFKCEFCDKSFKWKHSLNVHIRMHLNDKRHVCEVCQEAFVQQSSLKYHIVKKHPERV